MKAMYLTAALAAGLLATGTAANAQLLGSLEQFIQWSQNPLLAGANPFTMSSPDETVEELPGLGHKFELLGAMRDDADPENPTNDVISIESLPTNFGLAFRNMPPGPNIRAFDQQLNLKYFLVAPRSCIGGTPRVALFVDADGDGDIEFTANGHVNPPTYAGCLPDRWNIENLTDDGPRWEITPGGAVPGLPPTFPHYPWEVAEDAIATAFPNHRVLAGALIDDSCSFNAVACGKAYYDLLTIENRTLENDQDTVKDGR